MALPEFSQTRSQSSGRLVHPASDSMAALLDTLSPAALLALARRYAWVLLAGIVLGGGWAFWKASSRGTVYVSTARFIVGSGQPSQSPWGALVPQFGQGSSVWESPSFNADLITSREVLWQTANAPLALGGADTITLVRYFGLQDSSATVAKHLAVAALASWVNAVVVANGVVLLTVTTPSAPLSSAVAYALLDQVNAFNFEVRQRRIASERGFIERRLQLAQTELRASEERLKRFLETNRQYETSPELRFRHDRLAADVTLKQELFAAATQAYENARIEEIRDTPMTSLIEAPDMPLRPLPRRVARSTVFGTVGGFLLAGFGVLLLDLRNRVRRERESNLGAYP